MAEKITPRAENFSEWYQDVVLQAKLADYSPVKGCMVIRPNGYALWENIQKELDQRIKKTGAKNAYFPLLIPESFLKKEAQHVEGFAPQCAVVTYAGGKELEEKYVVRPTSETIINSMFAKWIQSYRDLPLLINQWCNVMRWEMKTKLFLRTTEFLWQEGHTCHTSLEEAENKTRQMLEVYKNFAEEILAMPVWMGLKSESEKFAGALRTYSIESMMQDKKALQAGTSHNLASNFAKAFDTMFLDQDGKQKHVYQTSWGVSTRLIGGLIMTHSDDKGFVAPPRLAETHIVIVPILAQAQMKDKILEKATELSKTILERNEIKSLPYNIKINIDADETKQPGWKFHEYELLGVPIRLELGPKDLEKNQVVLARRDLDKKEFISLDILPQTIANHLVSMQKDLFEKAKKFRDQNTFQTYSYTEFKQTIETKGGFCLTAWCKDPVCENKIKEETKATIRVLPLDSIFQEIPEKEKCIVCQTKKPAIRVLVARSY
ncbi:MAG: proline--tRNA ligase [Deltaproteobacteria bacterium]|nr:proline--tRNA ligase [Deltaproteobacteria bacterium]